MRKIIYPTYDNPPTTDEERALIERLKAQPMPPELAARIDRINQVFKVRPINLRERAA